VKKEQNGAALPGSSRQVPSTRQVIQATQWLMENIPGGIPGRNAGRQQVRSRSRVPRSAGGNPGGRRYPGKRRNGGGVRGPTGSAGAAQKSRNRSQR